MKKKIFSILAGLTLFVTTSCHDGFLTEQPYDFIGPDNFFNTAQELEDLVSGVPRIFREPGSRMMGRHWWLLSDTPAAFATNRYSLTHLRTQMDSWTYGPGHSYIKDIWQWMYIGINRANAVIDGSARLEGDTTEEPAGYNKVARIVGEAKFYRALYYFYLTEFYGDVPLKITETASANLDELRLAKSPRSAIYDQIKADLEAAIPVLAEAWEYSGADTGRPSKGGARTLLAKMLLQRSQGPDAQGSDISDASSLLDQVIGAGYGLADRFRNLIYYHVGMAAEDNAANNYEILYEVQFTSAGFGASGNYSFSPRDSDIGKNKWTVFAAEYNYVEMFEDGDERGTDNFVLEYNHRNDGSLRVFDQNDVKNDGYRDEAMSFTWRLDPEPANENREEPNMAILRYSDVLLLKAEAEFYLNGPSATAYEMVNRVRRRAFGFDPNTPNATSDWVVGSQANFKEALYIERMKELPFMTWGTIDMRRMWDVATPLVQASSRRTEIQNGEEITNDGPKHEITDAMVSGTKYKVFPTPLDVMDNNPSIEQHPEWASH